MVKYISRQTVAALAVMAGATWGFQESVRVPTMNAFRSLERRVAAIEQAVKRPPVDLPTVDPPSVPPPTRPPAGVDLPAIEIPMVVSWNIVLENGSRVRGSGRGAGGVFTSRAGPFHVAAFLDDFDGPTGAMQPTPSLILSNPYAGAGIVHWKRGSITVNSWKVPLGPAGCMPPRYAVVKTALELDDWRVISDEAPVPQALRDRALQAVQDQSRYHIGPYEFFGDWGDPAEPGGRSIAPYHGGARDWFRTGEGRFVRAAEAVGAASRGLWARNDNGTPWRPGDTRARDAAGRDVGGALYWWDATNVGYAREWEAARGVPGWGFSGDPNSTCAYEEDLLKQRTSDFSHAARWYRATAALAPYSRLFRYILMECCWEECKRSYSMDRSIVPHTESWGRLYNPLWWILEQTSQGSWGNRREAHALGILAEAWPYMSSEDRAVYGPAWDEFLVKFNDGRGCFDSGTCNGGANDWANASGVPCGVVMHFQQALIHEAAEWLGDYPEFPHAAEAAASIANFWGPAPTPYNAHTGNQHFVRGKWVAGKLWKTAYEAPNSLSFPPFQEAVIDYTWFTHPETVDFDAVLKRAVNDGLGQNPLDSVPPSARPKSWMP